MIVKVYYSVIIRLLVSLLVKLIAYDEILYLVVD